MKLKDASGTIDDAGSGVGKSTLALEAVANRNYLLIENPHETEDLWVNFSVDASGDSPSLRIAAKDHRVFIHPHSVSNSVYVYAATAGQKFTIKHS